MNDLYNNCIAEIGSVTQAMKAQKILSAAAIPSTVVKSGSSQKGCAYGILISCSYRDNTENLFGKAKVRVKRWTNET